MTRMEVLLASERWRTPSWEHARVCDVMQSPVIACPRDTPVVELARAMATQHVHAVIVDAVRPPSQPQPWGIVTDLSLAAVGARASELTAGDIAQLEVATAEPYWRLEKAARLMVDRSTSHLVVIDPSTGDPVGMLSTLDLAGILAWGPSDTRAETYGLGTRPNADATGVRRSYGRDSHDRQGVAVSRSDVPMLQRSVESANAWIDAVADELGVEDRHHAYRVLRAFLHTLRDRLTVNEAAQLAAQMPELIRGIYYEGWVPSRTPQKYRDAETFLTELADEAGLNGQSEASYAAVAAYAVLSARVTEGEIDDILAVLPEHVRQLLITAGGGAR